MKTKTMKAIRLSMLALILSISSSAVLTSCSDDDSFIPSPEPQPVILKGEDAVEWTKQHLDSLVDVYLASCGNLLDPDMTRDLLRCIGYTRLNVLDYREAGWLIDSVVFIRLMDRAVTCEAYITVFPQYKGRVEYIEEHYPDMKFYCLDNSHNNGGKRVSNEQAKLWDYSMTEDLKQKLYAIKQSYIDSGKLTAEQIEALH
ncbi:MAG: hypothetical protein K6B13_03525 [Prevotella sp.]|nr:hypothetical protein [Prevotella sp.]